MFRGKDEEDLRNDIIILKKQNISFKEDNTLLKVKVRKLQAQLDKKDKQIEALLEPVKSLNYHNVVSERSAFMIITLRKEIEKLQKTLQEKETVIKRLQEQLKLAKLYSQNQRRVSLNNKNEDKILKFISAVIKNNSGGRETAAEVNSLPDLDESEHDSRPRSTSWSPPILKSNSYPTIEDHYKTIERIARQKNESPQSDLARTELFEPPHEEIQKLQTHFFDMLLEVDLLKSTIRKLEHQQENTQEVLKEKDISIDELAGEINNLKLSYKSKMREKKLSGKLMKGSSSILNVEKIYKSSSGRKKTK